MNKKNIVKFSIIVVSLNTKKQFLQTIKSILAQSYKNYEIIVVDGLSKDGTKDEIIKRKKFFSHFIIEKDKGIYDAMNKGIDKVGGKWVIFMNSGDVFFNNKILSYLNTFSYENIDMIFGDTIIKTNFFNYLQKSKNFDSSTVLMPFSHQSIFVKSEKIKNRKFNTNYKFSSDFDFFLEHFLKKNKLLKIDKIISKVRSGGTADINRQKVLNENIKILKKKNINKSYYVLYYYKFKEFIKNIVKILLPSIMVVFFLKLKHRKSLIK